MRSIDLQEDNNSTIKLLSDLRVPEKQRILDSVQQIHDALSSINENEISTGEVVKSLMDIDKHVGHYAVQPLLKSFGIHANDSTVRIKSREEVAQHIQKLKSHIFQEVKDQIFMSTNTSIFSITEATVLDTQEVLT